LSRTTIEPHVDEGAGVLVVEVEVVGDCVVGGARVVVGATLVDGATVVAGRVPGVVLEVGLWLSVDPPVVRSTMTTTRAMTTTAPTTIATQVPAPRFCGR
jgi:hypothetical protein